MNAYPTRSKSTISSTTSKNRTLFEYGNASPGRGVITFTEHDRKQLIAPRFLNDTVISFFMQHYLDNSVGQKLKKRIHVFNTFFFAKIKSVKSKNHECERTAFGKAFDRWLKDVEIFKKDFLIIPVCEKEHWALVIVCYPARIPAPKSELIPANELYEPAVIVLNSSYGHAPSVKRALNQFLRYRWNEERGSDKNFAINNSKQSGIRLIFPELPQQKNHYNCGAYVLNYFYCFLKNPREAYIRMFRRRNMSKWFIEHNINVLTERKRMMKVVDEQTAFWKKSNESRQVADESQETHLSSPSRSSSSPVDIIENGEKKSHIIVIN